MRKRLKFKCWHCKREYTLQKDINPQVYNRLRIACPYCQRRGILELNKALKPSSGTFRDGAPERSAPLGLDLDQTFDTEPDEDETNRDE